jgi:hypothetical protein
MTYSNGDTFIIIDHVYGYVRQTLILPLLLQYNLENATTVILAQIQADVGLVRKLIIPTI